MNPSHFNRLGILVVWMHTSAPLGVNKPHIFTVESWNTPNLFSQDQLTSTYFEKGIRTGYWRTWEEMDKWGNKRCVTTQPYKRGFVERSHTLFPRLCALIFCSFFVTPIFPIFVQFKVRYKCALLHRVRAVRACQNEHVWCFQVVEPQNLFPLDI